MQVDNQPPARQSQSTRADMGCTNLYWLPMGTEYMAMQRIVEVIYRPIPYCCKPGSESQWNRSNLRQAKVLVKAKDMADTSTLRLRHHENKRAECMERWWWLEEERCKSKVCKQTSFYRSSTFARYNMCMIALGRAWCTCVPNIMLSFPMLMQHQSNVIYTAWRTSTNMYTAHRWHLPAWVWTCLCELDEKTIDKMSITGIPFLDFLITYKSW